MQRCFIVSIISAVAFTAIGTTAAIGNRDLVWMTNPYAFLYESPENNKLVDKHLSMIKTSRGCKYSVPDGFIFK